MLLPLLTNQITCHTRQTSTLKVNRPSTHRWPMAWAMTTTHTWLISISHQNHHHFSQTARVSGQSTLIFSSTTLQLLVRIRWTPLSRTTVKIWENRMVAAIWYPLSITTTTHSTLEQKSAGSNLVITELENQKHCIYCFNLHARVLVSSPSWPPYFYKFFF